MYKEGVCMLPTIEELQNMKEMDVREASREELVDITEIQIDKNLSADSRIRNYLEQIHNPFLVRAGEYVLKFQYADCDKDINDCMAEYVSKLSKIHC